MPEKDTLAIKNCTGSLKRPGRFMLCMKCIQLSYLIKNLKISLSNIFQVIFLFWQRFSETKLARILPLSIISISKIRNFLFAGWYEISTVYRRKWFVKIFARKFHKKWWKSWFDTFLAISRDWNDSDLCK